MVRFLFIIFAQLFSIFVTIIGKQKNSSSPSSATLIISVTFPIITMSFSRKGMSPNPNVKQEFFPALCCHLGLLHGFILISLMMFKLPNPTVLQ